MRTAELLAPGDADAGVVHGVASAEETLRRALWDLEERLPLAEELARFGMYDLDLIANRGTYDDGLRRILGIEADHGTYEDFLDAVHPEDRGRVRAAFQRTVRDYVPYEVTLRYIRPDGAIRWLVSRALLDRDAMGVPIRLLGVSIDVTEAKERELAIRDHAEERARAADALRGSEERFLRVAEEIDDAFWFSDVRPGGTTYVNPAWERLLGLRAQDIARDPRCWLLVIHPDDRARVRQEYKATLHSPTPCRFLDEFRLLRADGEVRWVRARGLVSPATGTAPARVSGIAEDITSRKRMEQGLRFLVDISALLSESLDVDKTFRRAVVRAVKGRSASAPPCPGATGQAICRWRRTSPAGPLPP